MNNNETMHQVTPTGIAVALAVVIALGFLFMGSSLFAPFESAEPQPALEVGQALSGNEEGKLMITDTIVGTGAEAAGGASITVNYVGKLDNGQVFDASSNHGQPFTFTLGVGQVIPGWDQGILGMKVGGKRTLVIPAELAYGDRAIGSIPANSTLTFEVELLDVQLAPQQ